MTNLFELADPVLGLPAVVCLVLGLVSLVSFTLQLRRGRPVRAGIQGVFTLGLFGLTLLFFLTGLNLHTYQRLTYEAPLAELHFQQLGPQSYRARLRFPGRAGERSYDLVGDEWQLDARILKWQPPANILGLDSRYRLERLSGRFTDVREHREQPQTAHGLAEEKGLELWSLLGKLQEYSGWVDTYYGSAAYLPMADSAEFEVVLTQSGLVARPTNEAARLALSSW